MRFVLISRHQCHLCDEMRTLLDGELEPRGLRYEVVDVDSDAELRERFGDVVPVLLRDGQVVAKVRLDARRLTRLIARRRD